MIKIKSDKINLYDTITCGQIFRYEIINNNEFIVILSDRVIRILQDKEYLYIYSNNYTDLEKIIINYLSLNIDYGKINKNLIENDKNLIDIINKCDGFRIINSPCFETMISYMISANNNVSNIKRCVNLISEKYGERITFENKDYYLFPSLDSLKKLTIDDYKDLKLGFRSENIYNFVNKITYSDIDNIYNLDTDTALNYLQSYKGIGLKIASCILLFGYKKYDVFPIDTWVKKYMKDKYNLNDINKIKEFTKVKYGKYSGIVIQYMFHLKRNK